MLFFILFLQIPRNRGASKMTTTWQQFDGKRLLRSELSNSSEEVTQLVNAGFLMQENGLIHVKGRMMCRRCGNDDPFLFAKHPCAKCQKTCTYCRHCLSLGKVSECGSLYRWTGKEQPMPQVKKSLMWQGELSVGQQKASDAVIAAIWQKKSLLVWAVCGAGKTEVLFRGLERAFEQGQRVLLATPRTDVVKELYPRLKKSFPTVLISALYGGSKERHPCAQFVIATTHQTMRFYKAFDVVIIDEVDAFPFSFDKSLQYAVTQAKKDPSATIYLSATPSRALLRDPAIDIIKIPLRYHGFPLPDPRFSWCGNWSKTLKKKRLPQQIKSWLDHQHSQNKPALLFVPSISTLKTVSSILQNKKITHAHVHAEDPKRHEVIQSFRDQQIPLLVTTTILERGVTFKGVQVAVLGAENDVFTEAALVQIAGRVGRSAQEPNGDIVFFHYGISQAMRAARRHIQAMNQEGMKK